MKRRKFIAGSFLLAAGQALADKTNDGEGISSIDKPLQLWFDRPFFLGSEQNIFYFHNYIDKSNQKFDSILTTSNESKIGLREGDRKRQFIKDNYIKRSFENRAPILDQKLLEESFGKPTNVDGPILENLILKTWRLWNGSTGSDCEIMEIYSLIAPGSPTYTALLIRKGAQMGELK